MNPISHFFASWLVSNTTSLNRRERTLITIAGVVPDLDGLVIIGDFFSKNSEYPLELWGKYHHVLTHNIGFAILVTLCSLAIAKKRKYMTALLVWISFHLHLFGDLVGARGPEGYQWPIPYLLPFSNTWQLAWKGQWALNAWPNLVITAIAIISTLFLAWKKSYSPIEIISQKADNAFIEILHIRFGKPKL